MEGEGTKEVMKTCGLKNLGREMRAKKAREEATGKGR